MSAGHVLLRPFFGTDGEAFGVAIAQARTGADFRAYEARSGRAAERTETDIELTYRLAPRPWLSVQPDLQYVIHPGAQRLGDALVIGVRPVVAWERD